MNFVEATKMLQVYYVQYLLTGREWISFAHQYVELACFKKLKNIKERLLNKTFNQ